MYMFWILLPTYRIIFVNEKNYRRELKITAKELVMLQTSHGTMVKTC